MQCMRCGNVHESHLARTMPNYIPLSNNSVRQYIDSCTVFEEFFRTKGESLKYAGSMYWRSQGARQYLLKICASNRQKRLGIRARETEQIYEAFTSQKAEIKARLTALRDAVAVAERLNRALRVGRVPVIVVSILRAIEKAGLSSHFTVVGTNALFAYEAAAGVRIAQSAFACRDVDARGEALRHICFLTDFECPCDSVLSILQRVDKTFRTKSDRFENAINSNGFEVRFFRRLSQYADRGTTRFEQVVVATSGKMAKMSTIDPEVFINYTTWKANQSSCEDPSNRRRDLMQASIVRTLIDESFTDFSLHGLQLKPPPLRNAELTKRCLQFARPTWRQSASDSASPTGRRSR